MNSNFYTSFTSVRPLSTTKFQLLQSWKLEIHRRAPCYMFLRPRYADCFQIGNIREAVAIDSGFIPDSDPSMLLFEIMCRTPIPSSDCMKDSSVTLFERTCTYTLKICIWLDAKRLTGKTIVWFWARGNVIKCFANLIPNDTCVRYDRVRYAYRAFSTKFSSQFEKNSRPSHSAKNHYVQFQNVG